MLHLSKRRQHTAFIFKMKTHSTSCVNWKIYFIWQSHASSVSAWQN